MADATPRRINIQSEEVRYRSAVSESTMTRVGQSINFINLKQYDSRGFFQNGPYFTGGVQAGVDGAWPVLFDVEIIGVSMFNLVAGTSGTTTLDVRRFTASNTPAGGASIFSVKPSITSAAGNNAFVFYDFLNSVVLENPTGTTLPVLSVTNLNAGDMLTLNIDSAQPLAQNCGLVLYYRPR